MPTALLIYYSFTGEAERAVRVATTELRAANMSVSTARVDFADPSLRLKRPLSFTDVKKWTAAAESGQRYSVVLEPAAALAQTYDLICLFSNTWQHHPCVPIRSLLALPELQSVLEGSPFAVYVICRRSWTVNLEIVRREAEKSGGQFIGGEQFGHLGSNLGSWIRTVSYLLSSGDKIARFLGIRLPIPEYGLSDSSLQRVAVFTRTIAKAALARSKADVGAS